MATAAPPNRHTVVTVSRMNKQFPKTLYRTPNPEWGISETYEIFLDVFPNPSNPNRCWIVREMHGWYEEQTKTFHHKVETLHPTDAAHFMAIEEAIDAANKQVVSRARQGFHFLFTMNLYHGPWYERFEVVLPGGELKPL